MYAVKFPGCSDLETKILQLRARGSSYRAIQAETGLSPRRVWLAEREAMTKVVRFLEREVFLNGKPPAVRKKSAPTDA